MGERIDKFMAENGLVKTRSQARMLIKQGDVLCNQEVVHKPGLLVSQKDHIEVKQRFLYVGRGALKLIKAIEEFQLDFRGKIIADCGASTGGFTQVALINGAQKVFAIDVGHDQLDTTLRNDERVICMEGVNLKYPIDMPEKVEFCLVDLSFISIKKVFSTLRSILKPGGMIVALIKPQFEVGPQRLGKKGVVPETMHIDILDEVVSWIRSEGLEVVKTCHSPIVGKAGNTEYLALIKEGLHT